MIRPDGAVHSILNHMIQLQDLVMARAQQEAARPGARLTKLKENIEELTSGLSEAYRDSFVKLLIRDGVAIVPMSNSACCGCGMGLPVGMANEVKAADYLINCPACARFLYFPSGAPRGVRKKNKPGVVINGIARFSGAELMLPKLTDPTPEALFKTISENMAQHCFIEDAAQIAHEALKREAILPTGVGHMIAFPHVRGVEGGGLTLSLATHAKGLDFGDKTKARLFFFMTIPTAASGFYVRLLAGLSQAFQGTEERDLLLACETPDDLWKALVKQTRKYIK